MEDGGREAVKSHTVQVTGQAHSDCPHCGIAGFLTCRACMRDTPWELKRDLKTAEGIEHVHINGNTLSPYRSLAACAAAVEAAKAAIFAHLKQFSSAI